MLKVTWNLNLSSENTLSRVLSCSGSCLLFRQDAPNSWSFFLISIPTSYFITSTERQLEGRPLTSTGSSLPCPAFLLVYRDHIKSESTSVSPSFAIFSAIKFKWNRPNSKSFMQISSLRLQISNHPGYNSLAVLPIKVTAPRSSGVLVSVFGSEVSPNISIEVNLSGFPRFMISLLQLRKSFWVWIVLSRGRSTETHHRVLTWWSGKNYC